MAKTWILVANASQAFIYEAQKAKLFKHNTYPHDEALILIKEYEHPASRKHTGELVSDRIGNYAASQTGGHGSFTEPKNPKEVEEDRFAQELAKQLDKGRIASDFNELIVIATPRFQGYLNKHLTSHLNKLLTCRVDKDYTHLKQRELIKQLWEHI